MIVAGICGLIFNLVLFLLWNADVWKTLAQDYSYSGKPPKKVMPRESGFIYYYRIAPRYYRKTLSVAIDGDARYVWLAKPIHPFKKMLRIQFSELNETGASNMYLWKSSKHIVFTTLAQPRIKICLSEDAVAWIKSEWNDFDRAGRD
ncbi:MAG: hypothetical protein ABJ275_10215 [Maricaulaceae bacterium]